MQAQEGKPAPDFTLYDSKKNKITLSEQRGHNVLLLFFPLAFTSVCTAELCSVSDNIDQYNDLDAKVFGISVDSLFTLARFKEDRNIRFPLLSDFNKEVSRQYNSLHDKFGYDMEGVSKRSAFIIDKEGILRYAEVLDNASVQPNFKIIRERLKELTT